MKVKKLFLACAAMAALFLFTTNCRAQDPVKAASNVYKLLKDTMGMRMLLVTFKPGEETAWHSHPDHMVYVVDGGKIEITDKGSQPQTMELKAGDAIALPAVTHKAKNVGGTTLKLVVYEKRKTVMNVPKPGETKQAK